MTPFRTLLACAAITLPASHAQNIAPQDGGRDPVLSALNDGFGEEWSPNSLDDSGAAAPSLFADPPGAPVLVTGTPPPDLEIHGELEAGVAEPEGVSVHVEPGHSGGAELDAKSVALLAPFPAKPLFQPPVGWRLEHPDEVPPFIREVSLSNGTRISLSIRPHLLVPDADGDQVVAINEPGYDPALRYAQTGTTAAVLASSVERMEEDSRKMTAALERLGQLLASLPSGEAADEDEDAPENESR